MTVAAYIRVSTRRQNDDGQRAEVKKWLDANGIDPTKVTWYCDKESGTTLKRPEFDRLQGDIFHGKVKTVVMWKLDRLSRRLKDGVATLADWSERGLRVVVVTQQLDFNLTALVASTSLSSIRPVLIHQFDDYHRAGQPHPDRAS